MNKKVLLISVDGMRPDGLQSCGNPFVQELEKRCSYTYEAKTVFPSVTLLLRSTAQTTNFEKFFHVTTGPMSARTSRMNQAQRSVSIENARSFDCRVSPFLQWSQSGISAKTKMSQKERSRITDMVLCAG